MNKPDITVGILNSKRIEFHICGYDLEDGNYDVEYSNGAISFNGKTYEELLFTPNNEGAYFTLNDVTIGIQFHWQRQEQQTFHGALKFIIENEKITAVNIISIEEYLKSVISSEMNSNASLDFLKSHAVISRSWAYARIFHYSHHSLYDVCADDHCQRYQGIQRITNDNAIKAVNETYGEVLTYDNTVCDTRYSKCCGGKTELFSTCWEDQDMPYLICKDDPYCNTNDTKILSQVLNKYDLETMDFHDWEVKYSQEELSEIVENKLHMGLGIITALTPIEIGSSGRIKYLKIEGTNNSITIGKELEIRRALSTSHLKSSAFKVERSNDNFILKGQGWGHGVGLCQIGAAVMGEKGIPYNEILEFYYPHAIITKLY